MSEANKAVAVRFLTSLGVGDVETLKTVMADDIVLKAMGTSVFPSTRLYSDLVAVCDGFPKVSKSGIDFRIINLTAEDERVSCEAEGYCTLLNGQEYNNWYHFLLFIRDGKVYLVKEYLDTKLADEVLAPFMLGKAG